MRMTFQNKLDVRGTKSKYFIFSIQVCYLILILAGASPKFLLTRIFFDPIAFQAKFLTFWPNSFLLQNFVKPNSFWLKNFVWSKNFFYPTFFQTHSREYLENNERSWEARRRIRKKERIVRVKRKQEDLRKEVKKNCSTIDITDARAKRDKVLEPFPKIPKFKIPCRQ